MNQKNMRGMILIAGLSLAAAAMADGGVLRLAITTSTENSGLMAELLPDFERHCDCRVRAIAVGSGKALEFGRRGDVDAVLTHAPAAEARMVADGYAIERRAVMHNDFVVIGPATDPANLAQTDDIGAALRQLATGGGRFVSRGDESGTHQKERALWAAAGGRPPGDWYIEAGSGMGRTLLLADELRAYTLSDRGTYLAFQDKIDARIVVQKSPLLQNPYSIMAINPARHPGVNIALARRFIEWLTSPPVQQRIGAYRYHGEVLFFPTVGD